MKPDAVRDVEKLYDQTLKYLEGEAMTKKPQDHGSRRIEYQNNFRTVPEKYLLMDNLMLLFKDV
jgi:hypothetical protein